MKFNFNWGKNNKPEMTTELTERNVNVYEHKNKIKGLEHIGEKKCAECGAWFMPSHQAQTLCSDECRDKRRRRMQSEWQNNHYHGVKKTLPDKQCKICGKTFTPKSPLQVMCSKECRMEADRRYQRRHAAELKAKRDEANNNQRKEGEKVFSEQITRANGTKWTPPVKTCPTCGKIFVATNNKQIYCCRECCLEATSLHNASKAKKNKMATVKTRKPGFYVTQASIIEKLVKSGVETDIVAKYLETVFGGK